MKLKDRNYSKYKMKEQITGPKKDSASTKLLTCSGLLHKTAKATKFT